MAEIKLTEQNFESEVINSDKPVLVDFWATWCGPCKMLSPVIKELADEFSDSLKVGKVNVDEEPSLAIKYGIQSIPTVIKFENGQAVKTAIGYRTKEEIVDTFDI